MTTSASKPEYELLKNSMSRKKSKEETPGVLILSNSFPFHFNWWNKKKTTAYYECSCRAKSGCTARAVLSKLEIEGKDRYLLTTWPEMEEHNHPGEKSYVIAQKVLAEMEKLVRVSYFIYTYKYRMWSSYCK